MAKKYLEHFYSYKWLPQEAAVVSQKKAVATVSSSERRQKRKDVRTLIDEGNKLFNEEKYQQALTNYLKARRLIYGLLYPKNNWVLGKDFHLQLNTNIFEHILSASVMVAKMDTTVDWSGKNIGSTMEPPTEFWQLMNRYTGQRKNVNQYRVEHLRRMGEMHLLAGETAEAAAVFEKAKPLTRDKKITAEINLALGNSYLLQENFAKAQPLLESSNKSFVQLKLTAEAGIAKNNLAVSLHNLGTKTGNTAMVTRAKKLLTLAQPNIPTIVRSVTPTFSVAPAFEGAITTPFRIEASPVITGARSGAAPAAAVKPEAVPVLFKPMTGTAYQLTKEINVQARSDLKEKLLITTGAKKTVVNLTQQNAASIIKSSVYEARVNLKQLDGLYIAAGHIDDFYISLPHLYYFTLPMSIADCYFEMNDFRPAAKFYRIASQYTYINKTVEVPLVWQKMAANYVEWANTLYRAKKTAAAKKHYEKVVTLKNKEPVIPVNSELYKAPIFAGIKAQVQAILDTPNPMDTAKHNPALVEPVLLSIYNLTNIANGIDFPLLSLEREQIPVFRFQYLQNVARYFAQQAVQAERTYINFKTKAEDEEFQRNMLEDVKELAVQNEILEDKMVDVAQAQVDAMQANYSYASTQRSNAQATRNDYSSVSWDLKELDAHIAQDSAINAGEVKVHESWSKYGLDTGKQKVHRAVFQATRKRGEISRDYELRNMDRRIEELKKAENVAFEQRKVAINQLAAANQKKAIATLRKHQAADQLDLFNSQEFTPELWNRLAQTIKYLSRSYLYRAIVIAKLMEQTYEFEIGEPVNIIKSNYIHNHLSGLLAGDFLLKDIDYFTYNRIVTGEKVVPVKEVISLSEAYPFQFQKEFIQTGRMSFSIDLFDLDRTFPGTYLRRIKRMEVVVEGLIGPRGIRGTLTNTGISFSRHSGGSKQMRLLQPETLALSEYRISGDAVVFPVDPEKLSQFELSPVASGWILDIPPRSNDIDYRYVTDIKLVVYYEAFYAHHLKSLVLEELSDQLPSSYQTRFALKYEFTDAYIGLQDSGELEFTFETGHFPFQHENPLISRLGLFFNLDDGSTPTNLLVEVSALSSNKTASQRTTAKGMISSDGNTPLKTFKNIPLLQTWKIRIPRNKNQALFNAGFTWQQVSDITFTAEYSFTHKTMSDEPRLVLDDSFSTNPMPGFDIVDDPGAVHNKPSKWAYNSTKKWIQQTSNIHAPAGAANLNTLPAKPGTYLLKKVTSKVPALQDFIFTCRVSSGDDDGIGLVFRYRDVNNFYFFLMDSQRKYRRIGKKVSGAFRELDSPAVDTAKGFKKNKKYTLKIIARGITIRVYLDGRLVLKGTDTTFNKKGRLGFYSWGNSAARFENIRIVAL